MDFTYSGASLVLQTTPHALCYNQIHPITRTPSLVPRPDADLDVAGETWNWTYDLKIAR